MIPTETVNDIGGYEYNCSMFTANYSDVLMSAMASQITRLTIVTQPFIQAQIKENIKAFGEFTGDQWIPRTKASNAENVPFDDVIMTFFTYPLQRAWRPRQCLAAICRCFHQCSFCICFGADQCRDVRRHDTDYVKYTILSVRLLQRLTFYHLLTSKEHYVIWQRVMQLWFAFYWIETYVWWSWGPDNWG